MWGRGGSWLPLEGKLSRPIPREAVTDEVSPFPIVPSWSKAARFPPHPPQCAHWGTFPALPHLPFPGLLCDGPPMARLR